MKYKIEGLIGRGFGEAPPFVVEVDHPDWLDSDHEVLGELCDDYGNPFPVGASLTITRVE